MGRIINLKGNDLLIDSVTVDGVEMVGTTPDAEDVVIDDAAFTGLTGTDLQTVIEDVDVQLAAVTAGKIRRNTPVAATGTNLATAAQIEAGFTAVTDADDTVGVKLPATPVAGTVCIVKSTVADKILKVYPDAAATINAIGSNGAISLASGPTIAMFIADSTTQWYTLPLLPS